MAVQTQRQVPLAWPEHNTGSWKGREVLGAIGDVLKLYFGAWNVDTPKLHCRAHLSPREPAEIDALLMGLPPHVAGGCRTRIDGECRLEY